MPPRASPWSLRALLRVAWRARHLLRSPFEAVEGVLLAFRLGLAALAGAGVALIVLLVALVASFVQSWREPALVVALVALVLAVAALTLGAWLFAVVLPRRVRALVAFLRDAPARLEREARELARIVDEVEREERARLSIP